jgi:hypothetical protein
MTGASEVPPIGAIRLHPAQLFDATSGSKLELARVLNPTGQRVHVQLPDILAALATLGEPEPEAPMLGSNMAHALRRSLEHAQSVRRGFAPDEVDTAPAIRQMPRVPVTADGASIYVPDPSAGDD